MRALYVGYTRGTENHGDEALIWILRDLLAPEIEVVTQAAEYDFALLGGGTLINQSPWLIDHFESLMTRSRTGRAVVFGTGVGDLAFWGDTFDRWVPLLERCAAVGVRGPDSLDLLRSAGFSRGSICGDPYLWLRSPVRRPPVSRHLGVNFGSTNNSLWGGSDDDFLRFVTEALTLLAVRGWTFSFLSVWSRDLPLLEEVRTRLGAPAAGPVFDARTQTLETYSMLARCEVFLGEKLHANAMAAVAGVPFLALEYQPKVRDFARSLAMDEWTQSTAQRDPRQLADRIEALHAQRRDVSLRMIRTRNALRSRLTAFAEEIKTQLLQSREVPL